MFPEKCPEHGALGGSFLSVHGTSMRQYTCGCGMREGGKLLDKEAFEREHERLRKIGCWGSLGSALSTDYFPYDKDEMSFTQLAYCFFSLWQSTAKMFARNEDDKYAAFGQYMLQFLPKAECDAMVKAMQGIVWVFKKGDVDSRYDPIDKLIEGKAARLADEVVKSRCHRENELAYRSLIYALAARRLFMRCDCGEYFTPYLIVREDFAPTEYATKCQKCMEAK